MTNEQRLIYKQKKLLEMLIPQCDFCGDYSDRFMTLLSEVASLESKLAKEHHKDKCIYINEQGNCWAIKSKCDPGHKDCDYRINEPQQEPEGMTANNKKDLQE